MVAESPVASRSKLRLTPTHDTLCEAWFLADSTGHVSLYRHLALSCFHAPLHRFHYVLVDMRRKMDGTATTLPAASLPCMSGVCFQLNSGICLICPVFCFRHSTAQMQCVYYRYIRWYK